MREKGSKSWHQKEVLGVWGEKPCLRKEHTADSWLPCPPSQFVGKFPVPSQEKGLHQNLLTGNKVVVADICYKPLVETPPHIFLSWVSLTLGVQIGSGLYHLYFLSYVTRPFTFCFTFPEIQIG